MSNHQNLSSISVWNWVKSITRYVLLKSNGFLPSPQYHLHLSLTGASFFDAYEVSISLLLILLKTTLAICCLSSFIINVLNQKCSLSVNTKVVYGFDCGFASYIESVKIYQLRLLPQQKFLKLTFSERRICRIDCF